MFEDYVLTMCCVQPVRVQGPEDTAPSAALRHSREDWAMNMVLRVRLHVNELQQCPSPGGEPHTGQENNSGCGL